MNRSELKSNAKKVLSKNFFSAVLFSFVFHTVTGRFGADLAFILTFIFYDPNNIYFKPERIGFTTDTVNRDFLYAISMTAIVLLLIVFSVFFVGPMHAAKANYYLNAKKDTFRASSVFVVFRNDFYPNVFKTMLMRNLILLCGSLLIIPGIYYSYAYYFVPQIIAEYNGMDWKDALKKSKEITKGYKFRLFTLDLSFAGWYLLALLIPVIGVYIAYTYRDATVTEAYEFLKMKNT
jgi:uncharacterized membrane protein